MTADPPKRKKKAPRLISGRMMLFLFAVFFLLLLLRNTELAANGVRSGLLLCAKSIIPSLFPSAVLCEILLSARVGGRILARLTKPMQKLLRLPAAGCSVILLGFLCGFPIGTKGALAAYEQGRLTKKETERALTISNLPSPAFLIGAVGISLWQSRIFGIALYTVALLSAMLIGLGTAFWNKKEEPPTYWKTSLSCPETVSGFKLFTHAVSSATGSILTVCAYVIFFSVITSVTGLCLTLLGLSKEGCAFFSCLLELTSGIGQATSLPPAPLSALLCAFATGWSGLSVHCQLLSFCDGKRLSFALYFLAKLLQGILCALLFGAAIYLFPTILTP